MNFWITFLIGIVYVAQLKVVESFLANTEPIFSENGQKIPCGRRWKPNGVMYHVFYTYEDDEANITHPLKRIYEYCMNEDTKSVMYAKYDLDDPTLLKPESPKYEIQEPDVTEVSEPLENQLFDVNPFSPKDIFETRKYYENPTLFEFEPQMVVVPELMPTIDIRRGFYSFDIAAPVQSELINPWKELMKKIQSKIYNIKEPLKVYSGTYDTYRIHGLSWFIDRPKHKLPVPFAWFLLLHNTEETRGISVVIQNYAFSPEEEKKALCGESVCGHARLEIPQYNRAWIYCCHASTITEEYPLTNKKIDDLLIFE